MLRSLTKWYSTKCTKCGRFVKHGLGITGIFPTKFTSQCKECGKTITEEDFIKDDYRLG